MNTGPKICLNMIVKDESAVIARCLRSVLPAVDYCVICDTASTDGTPAMIREIFDSAGMQGEIHRISFVNFETTRNYALDLCRNASADFDYILLCDADMELVIADPNFREKLTQSAYSIRQHDGLCVYYNTRLIRRHLAAKYVGVTHEYLELPVTAQRFDQLMFRHHADGSGRAVKLPRDIALLREALRREPDNSRYMFYLAQCLRESGEYREAIEWYVKRTALGSFEEEIWYSIYMCGFCYLNLGLEEKFIRICLEAYNRRPQRAEPLYHLAKLYRTQQKYEACMMLCETAERIPFPENDMLFIEEDVYSTGILMETSIAGYYCNSTERKTKGREACLHLIHRKDAHETIRQTALANFTYYAKSLTELFPGGELCSVEIPATKHVPTNPSIWLQDGRHYGIVRGVNYEIKNGSYLIHDPSGVIRTQNFFVQFDDSFHIREWHEMQEPAQSPQKFNFPVQGFEDCRLFYCRGKFHCMCTVRDRNADGRCEIALLTLDQQYNIAEMQLLEGLHAQRHQKNWVPIVSNDELFLIYTTDPTVIFRYDFERKCAALFCSSESHSHLKHLRGGSQAVRMWDGWLYVTHEVATPAGGRRYLHRFVLLNRGFEVAGFTEPFYFVQPGIEFCAGLAHDAELRRLILSFSTNDRGVCVAVLDAESVFALLHWDNI